jgi:hypothetical protein
MPAYPAMLEVGSGLTRMSPLLIGVILSAVFEFGALMLSWMLLGQRNFAALVACALVPGMIYHHAVFPISMCVFFVLLTLRLLTQSRWVSSGIAGALAAMTYSTGFLLAPIAALWAFAGSSDSTSRFRRAALVGGLAACGLGAVLVLHQVSVGAWDAFLRVQSKYEHGVNLPTVTLVEAVRPLWTGDGPRAPAIQALIVATGFLTLAGWRKASGYTHRDLLFLGTGAAYWLVPLITGGVSLYRADALLVPALLLLGDAPRWVNALICILLGTLAFVMAQLFFRGVLV